MICQAFYNKFAPHLRAASLEKPNDICYHTQEEPLVAFVRPIRWRGGMKILFVCSSNVCRSPYCEFILRRLINSDAAVRDKLEVSSAAVVNRSHKLFPKGRDRLLADGFSAEELDNFTPRYKRECMDSFEQADAIIGMSRIHKLFVPKRFRSKYCTLSEAALGKYIAIPDPFLGSKKSYNATMDKLQEYVSAYFEKLKQLIT